MKPVNKFLIINPFGIGDVLFTTPLISNLRKNFPQAFIGYIANRRSAPIIESNKKVNKVYIYEHDEFKKNRVYFWHRLYRQLRVERFDTVFDCSLNAPLGFLGMVCGIRRRIGYDYRGRGKFLTDRIPFTSYEDGHVVGYYLDLLSRAGIPITEKILEIYIDADHQRWAKEWLSTKGINSHTNLVAVVPGGGASWGNNAVQKRWSGKQYAGLVDKMIAKSKPTVILMGDFKEKSLEEEITHQCSRGVYDALGQTTLLQMAALLRLCRLAIVNDGGPLHMAVALGVKTASIFGSVDPNVYGPYPATGHIVIQKGLPCQPCYRQFRRVRCGHLSCLKDLSVEEVFDKIERLL